MNIRKLVLAAVVSAVALPFQVQAETFGLGTGRSANPDDSPGLSVEAGITNSSNFGHLGLRVNYKLSPDIVVYGDIGQSEFGNFDGLIFGAGAFYALRDIVLLENTDFGVKGSIHTGSLELSGCENFVDPFFGALFAEVCDADVFNFALEAHISGAQLGASNFGWYGNAGIHSLDLGVASSTEIGFGGGVFSDTGFGSFYAGIDFIDEFTIVAGVRYHLN